MAKPEGLQMKYFVLNPNKDNEYGWASQDAIYTYADSLEIANPALAHDLRMWVGGIVVKQTKEKADKEAGR